ncbi:hypothetical protein PM082_023615 [Marasmius tenuissimus]|nr:hypothetical protein PM082_023615 [Marasmius tenuissimus]
MTSNMTNNENVRFSLFTEACTCADAFDQASLGREYYAGTAPGKQASLKISRPRPLLRKEPKLDQLDGGNPFADHTNVSDTSSKKVVEKDEEQIGLWMEKLELKEETAEKRPHPETSNSLVHASDLLRSDVEETEPVPNRFLPELPNDEMRDLGSRFSDDMSNAGIPEFPLKPISYTDMSAPVFTNPFGNPNETFRPLSPLYSDEYIDLPDVFLQPGGYTASVPQASPSSAAASPRSTEELEKSIERAILRSKAKEISPLDTSEMTPADRKVVRRTVFNHSQSRRHASSKYKPKLAAAFRARQREIKARKASHSRPIVPPRPKKSFMIPYFQRRDPDLECDTRMFEHMAEGNDSSDSGSDSTSSSGSSSTFGGLMKWAMPSGMMDWVLRK